MFNISFGEDKYWAVIQKLGWPKPKRTARKTLKEALESRSGRGAFVLWCDNKANFLLRKGLELDSSLDRAELKLTAFHVIGLGKEEYDRTLEDPQLLVTLFNSGDYNPNFTALFPGGDSFDSPKMRAAKKKVSLKEQIDNLKVQVAEAEQKLFTLRQELATKIDKYTQEES